MHETRGDLVFRSDFDKLFEWLSTIKASDRFVDFDASNLEHVFSIVELSHQLGLAEGARLCRAANNVMLETLDSLSLSTTQRPNEQPNAYRRFADALATRHARRRAQLRGIEWFRDVLITLNYDLLLECALASRDIGFDYCLDRVPAEGAFQLLKLHGSTNWLFCDKCGRGPELLSLDEIVPAVTPPNTPPPLFKRPAGLVTTVLPKLQCKGCREIGSLAPRVIPPTWSKSIMNRPEAHVWSRAVDELKRAERIIVIGYSMPQTDTFFRYLLTLALRDNSSLERVVVVNPDADSDFNMRYYRLFSSNLRDKQRLRMVSQSFEDFVAKGPAVLDD